MVLLSNEAFLTELTKFFQKSRLKGSVSLTMKRYDGRTTPIPREGKKPLPPPSEYHCLMRATYKTKKISTVIHQKDVSKFQAAYCILLKGNLDGLKKLKKSKNKPKTT
ncbi:Signal recognition particle 14 kDa protein, putative [Pediculus humanus corporis]|uniref:Signal recognition particle 14 kDa protein n=1 Tax=Pediculus humanus subsp. corporis TaxID=121224 RepID=E0W0A2_PEDHC|nr:Signal recognition particle 14 kDa protein, putative [Pediculus humanus corporis]EEB19058.1 Signal recognition particle 14 kDa protein, putative [Pediculus humanus corporis]